MSGDRKKRTTQTHVDKKGLPKDHRCIVLHSVLNGIFDKNLDRMWDGRELTHEVNDTLYLTPYMWLHENLPIPQVLRKSVAIPKGQNSICWTHFILGRDANNARLYALVDLARMVPTMTLCPVLKIGQYRDPVLTSPVIIFKYGLDVIKKTIANRIRSVAGRELSTDIVSLIVSFLYSDSLEISDADKDEEYEAGTESNEDEEEDRDEESGDEQYA